jgi:RNA polymerase I specific transcription initiation factor
MDELEQRKARKAKREEYDEYDRVLRTLDHKDSHDLAANLLLVARYKNSLDEKRANDMSLTEMLRITPTWTAWPLPADAVPRQRRTESLSESGEVLSPLQEEIEAAILRISRQQIQQENPSLVSPDDTIPNEFSNIKCDIIKRLDALLQVYGEAKSRLPKSRASIARTPKSRWDGVVKKAGTAGCFKSAHTKERVVERCMALFENMG